MGSAAAAQFSLTGFNNMRLHVPLSTVQTFTQVCRCVCLINCAANHIVSERVYRTWSQLVCSLEVQSPTTGLALHLHFLSLHFLSPLYCLRPSAVSGYSPHINVLFLHHHHHHHQCCSGAARWRSRWRNFSVSFWTLTFLCEFG